LIGFDGHVLTSTELFRFANVAHHVEGHLRWDWTQMRANLAQGLALAAPYHPASVGVDTWGVDHALLDAAGNLLFEPIHYRDDARNSAANVASLTEKVPIREIFAATGIQNMSINTIYQLHWYAQNIPETFQKTATVLYMPDLINYWLTGVRVNEFTDATTSQAYNPQTRAYAFDILARLGVPEAIFPPVVQPGTILGPIILNHPLKGVPVIAPATHDTGSAVAAVPAANEYYAYLSSGTWSLLGLERRDAILSPGAFAANVTNEGGVAGTYRFLKNIVGLWILQEARRTWAAGGTTYDYAHLVELAAAAAPFQAFIDPNAPEFLPPGDMPERIRAYCARTNQPAPETIGGMVRCILESLAMTYRAVLDELIALSGQRVDVLHIIGGGSNNQLLCQMAANATNRAVLAGPSEATSLGNAMVQLIGLGKIESLEAGRAIVRASVRTMAYQPQPAGWEAAFARFRAVTGVR
jgi:rhamnulokinase